MAARRNNCVPEIWLLLIGVNAIIEREESRKTNEEINSIKCRPYGVGRMAIFEGVVRKRTARQSFHECREIRQYHHNADKQDLSADPCLKRRHNLAKAGVGKYMIGREVEMCCEVEGYWYVVEPVRGLEKKNGEYNSGEECTIHDIYFESIAAAMINYAYMNPYHGVLLWKEQNRIQRNGREKVCEEKGME